MHINRLHATNFMIFNDIDLEFSPHINVISGENSTGKTILLKLLYASLKGYSEAYGGKGNLTKENIESCLVKKIQGVFRPDHDAVGRLVNRLQGSNRADINIALSSHFNMMFGFSNRQSTHIDLKNDNFHEMGEVLPVYIPPKEIISATENFGSLYSDYHIAFEETYYDLTRLLEKPLRKGANTKEQNIVLQKFEEIVQGKILQRDKKFYLKIKGAGEFEMGLVSEGYRKIATIMYLILSGSLTTDSILFWDEPETNMNPRMIKPMTDALVALAKMGVQIFVTTHDYFIQQCLNLNAEYCKKDHLSYQFISLFKSENGRDVQIESANCLSDLSYNAIMDEFDTLYDREQDLIYGR